MTVMSINTDLNLQPTLLGPRLRLRPLTTEDQAGLFAAVSDPLIWDQHPAKRYRPEVFAEFFAQSLASGGCLVVEDREKEAIVGTSRYQPAAGHPGIVEIGWTVLARDYWGGSYNREMKTLMVAHLTAAGRRAILNIAPGNHRSVRAAEKIGGRLTTTDYHPELVDPRPGYSTFLLPEKIAPAQ